MALKSSPTLQQSAAHSKHTGNKPIKTKGQINLQQDCVTTLMQANQEN